MLCHKIIAFKNRLAAVKSEGKSVDALCLDCSLTFNYGVSQNCNLKINSN